MQIRWTREALERLTEIEDYISKDSPERTTSFVNDLIDQTAALEDHPGLGRVVPEIGNENMRELIARKYRIIYRVSKDGIEILTIFKGHRLLRLEELDNN